MPGEALAPMVPPGAVDDGLRRRAAGNGGVLSLDMSLMGVSPLMSQRRKDVAIE